MKKPMRVFLLVASCVGVALTLLSCGEPPSPTCVLAPPGPGDLGPATGLSMPPADAVAFDLKYLVQIGGPADIQYHSYWGYGGPDSEAKTNSFLQAVRKKSSGLYYVKSSFPGREWSAVEYTGRRALTLYFDLDADGKLGENERILPTRNTGRGVEFITPDFMNPSAGGGPMLCRALLQVNFWSGSSEPNCMWSPAALLEGTATLNNQSARVLLYANSPGGSFDRYGASSYSLMLGDPSAAVPGQYIPRETLSTLIASEGQFYHLTVEGRRSNGLPARVLLAKDTSPTGTISVKLAGSNSLQATLTSLYLNGVNDKTVFFRVGASKEKVSLPEGTYALNSGGMSYGASNPRDWEVSFTQGPWATVKAGEVVEVALGQPTLKVRAIDERDRYNPQAIECATFKKGTPLYLEPRVVGKNLEVFGRFRQSTVASGTGADRPPRITITGPGGKQLLSKVMEYG